MHTSQFLSPHSILFDAHTPAYQESNSDDKEKTKQSRTAQRSQTD